jgi:hypothetical protein
MKKKDNVIQFPKEKCYPITPDNADFTIQSSDITLKNNIDLVKFSNYGMAIEDGGKIKIQFDINN